MLARQDGGKPRLSNERYRVREACRAAEERYGLRRTAPGDRTAARRPTRAEHEKTRRRGWSEPPRVTLRRAVSTAAAGASSEQEFFARLDRAGVLVRKRMSTRNPAEVTGYAVALPSDATQRGGPVWFSGGKLAADLTWPKLRRRWEPSRSGPAGRFTSGERDAIWEQAAKAVRSAATQIRVTHGNQPGRRGRCRLGGRRHPARGRRSARQPGAPPGRRQLRPRCPRSIRADSPSDADRQQPAPGRTATRHDRRRHRRQHTDASDAGHPARRARRGCRRAAFSATPRRPGRRRPPDSRAVEDRTQSHHSAVPRIAPGTATHGSSAGTDGCPRAAAHSASLLDARHGGATPPGCP